MAHLILDTINKKSNLFGNIRNFPCKHSEYSISLVLADLIEAATQAGSAAEAWRTLQFVKSIVGVIKPLSSASYPHNPDHCPLDQSFAFSGPLHSWALFESPSLAQGQTCGSSLLLEQGGRWTKELPELYIFMIWWYRVTHLLLMSWMKEGLSPQLRPTWYCLLPSFVTEPEMNILPESTFATFALGCQSVLQQPVWRELRLESHLPPIPPALFMRSLCFVLFCFQKCQEKP